MKPHLLQFQNCLPGLRSVHEVIFIASFPHLQVTIFESEAIGCREGCNGRETLEGRREMMIVDKGKGFAQKSDMQFLLKRKGYN